VIVSSLSRRFFSNPYLLWYCIVFILCSIIVFIVSFSAFGSSSLTFLYSIVFTVVSSVCGCTDQKSFDLSSQGISIAANMGICFNSSEDMVFLW